MDTVSALQTAVPLSRSRCTKAELEALHRKMGLAALRRRRIRSAVLVSLNVVMALFILFMMAFSMTGILTLALNFGATRNALFAAVQGMLAVYAVGGWAISALFSALPVWCGWPRVGAATALMLNTSPAFLAAGAAAAVLGLLSGVMLARSRLLGGLLIVLAVLLLLAGTFWLVITGGAFSGEGWGSLPWLLPLALGLAAAVADAFLYRYLKRYVVR